VSYRTIEIAYRPRSHSGQKIHTAARKEAARLWRDLAQRHFRIRRRHLKWPSKARWQRWAKRRYPGLSAQSVQQIVGEFCEAVCAIRQLRKNGQPDARYPWKQRRYRDVVYTNQDARVRDGWLLLPNGQSGTLRLRLPEAIPLPGRLIEVRLCCRRVLLVCEAPDEPRAAGATIGIDLGVNTLVAATDGEIAVLVSGREAKATVRGRHKCRRTYRCECGVIAPRDVIGSLNHLCLGRHGSVLPGQRLPSATKYLRPRCRSSSGGHPASSSGAIPRSPRL
jgi:transposase